MLVERIVQNVTLNGFSWVDVAPRAVHDQSGLLPFHIDASPGKSSVNAHHVTRPLQTLMVEAITLDDYIRAHGWPRVDVLKIDIEGNDCQALLGARKTLARFQPFVVFEYWYSTPPDVAEGAFVLLDGLGYTLRALLPNGQQALFDWRQTPSDRRHIDVLCFHRSDTGTTSAGRPAGNAQ